MMETMTSPKLANGECLKRFLDEQFTKDDLLPEVKEFLIRGIRLAAILDLDTGEIPNYDRAGPGLARTRPRGLSAALESYNRDKLKEEIGQAAVFLTAIACDVVNEHWNLHDTHEGTG